MKLVEFQWLYDEASQKDALKKALGCSGQLIKRYFSSKEQDRHISSRDLVRLPLEFVNHLLINPTFSGARPVILKETSDYLAIHKPAGVHCHPLLYSDENTVLNFLVEEKKWEPLLLNPSQYDRGLLYRLDYETSGILLLAKKQETFDLIRKDFLSSMKQKIYLAIVEGEFNLEGTFTHHFLPSGSKGSKQKVSTESTSLSQSGTLQVKKVLYEGGKSFVVVQLRTGLRHQIRAQLAAMGFPILGDELYGGKKAERLFLHAYRYESTEVFEDPNADLFGSYFDLNRALQVGHDVIRTF